jgi:hypothetical protein
MSNRTIISLFAIGAVMLIFIVFLNQIRDILSEHPAPPWFILGFGSCLVIEAIVWWCIELYKRYFP